MMDEDKDNRARSSSSFPSVDLDATVCAGSGMLPGSCGNTDDSGLTLAHLALLNGHVGVFRMLAARGADLNVTMHSPTRS